MPRSKLQRKVIAPPRFKGFKPYGCVNHDENPIELLYEEYEAIKLADYKLMNHQEAAVLMGVSRATFARIYEKARRKIARALVETREIITISGNSFSDQKWFLCNSCHSRFTIPRKIEKKCCPLCRSLKIETIFDRTSDMRFEI
ncbi:MAG: DUF134 domain-containing protein [Prolixibacteraceae bacterium]|nr:DUF134 domain-containing protein [Prolixibacteraceae bacterium]MBN2648842.1 DUF134 domain-containing protein [Prolixibacteraceae bacterium]